MRLVDVLDGRHDEVCPACAPRRTGTRKRPETESVLPFALETRIHS
jgi:hypothetical protein